MFKYDLGNYVQFKVYEDENSYEIVEGTVVKRNFSRGIWEYGVSGDDYHYILEEDIVGKIKKPSPTQYLIWADSVDKEDSSVNLHVHYQLCLGITEKEAVIHWFRQNHFDIDELDKTEDGWSDGTYILSVIQLVDKDDLSRRRTLKWVDCE